MNMKELRRLESSLSGGSDNIFIHSCNRSPCLIVGLEGWGTIARQLACNRKCLTAVFACRRKDNKSVTGMAVTDFPSLAVAIALAHMYMFKSNLRAQGLRFYCTWQLKYCAIQSNNLWIMKYARN